MEKEVLIQSAREKRKRIGKTMRDHKSGAWLRCIHNREARGEWSKSLTATGHHTEPFPTHTCNGHRYYRGAGKKLKVKPFENSYEKIHRE